MGAFGTVEETTAAVDTGGVAGSDEPAPGPGDPTPGGTAAGDTAPNAEVTSARHAHAQHIVRQNAVWAFGAGAVPVPLLDVLGIAAVQLRMVKQLCLVYRVEFREQDAKNLIASLMASLGSVAVGAGLMGSLLKALPLVGQTMGGAAVAITAGASVHAIGNVFIRHFDAKGTLQSLDTARMRGYFREEFEKAKRSVREGW